MRCRAGIVPFERRRGHFGWCPPVPLFRRRGVRAVAEIERERYALKALRGDFDAIPRAVLAAIDS